MSRHIEKDVIHIVEHQLGVTVTDINHRLSQFGADAIDRVEIVGDIEELLSLKTKLSTDHDMTVRELIHAAKTAIHRG